MRGEDNQTGRLFSYVDLEARVPSDHPLRLIREIVNDVLADLSGDFARSYSGMGRPSIPPEQLLRSLLLQAFYSIRSERQLVEQLDFNLLFRWFVGLGLDQPVWHSSSYAKNRDRFLASDISAKLLNGVVTHERVRHLLSREHFSVDGTLVEAWASMKSFKPKEGDDQDPSDDGPTPSASNKERNFRGEKRSNETHASTTDPQARLYRKGNSKESRLCYLGHALMENRQGLAIGGGVTLATGTAEREAALDMVDAYRPMDEPGGGRRITLAGDKGYDVSGFVDDLRDRKITPHIAVQNYTTKSGKQRKTRIDGRTTRHPGYDISQIIRKRIEEIFGWVKVNGGQNKTKFRGLERVNAAFVIGLTAYNLIRLPKLLKAPP